jgi:hypothetical protein
LRALLTKNLQRDRDRERQRDRQRREVNEGKDEHGRPFGLEKGEGLVLRSEGFALRAK